MESHLNYGTQTISYYFQDIFFYVLQLAALKAKAQQATQEIQMAEDVAKQKRMENIYHEF